MGLVLSRLLKVGILPYGFAQKYLYQCTLFRLWSNEPAFATYQVAANQTVVDAGEILSRVQKVVSARTGVATPKSGVVVPNKAGAAYPVELTPNAQLQALDCGYYNAGSRARQTQSVQPGCTDLAVSQDTNGARAGYAGAVPAGAQFAVDAAWAETRLLGQ